MSLAEATPSASMRIASLPSTTPSRVLAKPGTSRTRMVVFPIAEPMDCAAATVSSETSSWRTNSSSSMSGTGLKKCIPITRSGQLVAPAMSEIGRLEVLVANTA